MSTNTVVATSQIKTRTGVISSSGTLLAENLNRSGLILQNLGTNPLYVAFSTGAVAGTTFDFILKGSGSANDGTGGIMSFDVLSYTGIISIDGTGISCTATEL